MKNKKQIYILALCWLAYTTAYIGRLNFAASKIAISAAFGSLNAEVGLALTFFFFCYGAGQLVNGMLCHKYNSRLVIFISLIGSALLNLAIIFSSSVSIMKFIWGINGFVQSLLWSSLIQILSKYMPDSTTVRVAVVMSTTVAIGTVLAYGFSSMFVYLGNWKAMFIFSAIVLSVVSVLWYFGMGKALNGCQIAVKISSLQQIKKRHIGLRKTLVLSSIFVFITAVANGLIKDGIISWMPEILESSFSVPKHLAIIITLVLPLISIGGAFLAAILMSRFNNHLTVKAICFMTSSLMLVLIISVANSIFSTVICFAIVSCLMATVNNLLTSIIPLNMRLIMSSGRVAGIINTFCYIGSSIAGYGLGAISDASTTAPWTPVLKLLLLTAATVSIIAYFAAVFWKKKMLPIMHTKILKSENVVL